MRKVLRRTEAGFTLIEMLIVVLLVGVLAAVAAPLYFGYVKDSKTAEGKALVGAMWTAWQAAAFQNCGVAQPITGAYPRTGLTATGVTNPARWDISAADAETLTSACADGALTLSAPVVTTGVAAAADLADVQIRLSYIAAQQPPVVLECKTTAAGAFGPC